VRSALVSSLARAAFVAFALSSAACATPPDEDTPAADDATSTEDLTASAAKLTFTAGYTVEQSKPLVAGGKVQIVYEAGRVRDCRGEANGQPAWTTTGFFQLAGGASGNFEAAGFSPSGGKKKAIIDLPAAVVRGEGAPAGDLALWFQTTNRWGCSAFDSNYGANYHVAIAAPANAPGWLGQADVVTSRATCADGKACDADRRPLGAGFLYDTGTAQRAAIRQVSFQVYRAGTTDRDDADLWKKLDVRAYSRVGKTGAFKPRYLPFDARVGDNARYVLELRGLAPFSGNTVTKKADCPAFSYRHVGPAGAAGYVEAEVEFYFWINGVELRAANGAPFVGTYQDYAGLYALCE
jgi:hypothetical protein